MEGVVFKWLTPFLMKSGYERILGRKLTHIKQASFNQ
jgi:hypothetical protein